MIQKVNAILHQEPIASIFHALYWTTVFIIGFPIVIVFLAIQCIVNVVFWSG